MKITKYGQCCLLIEIGNVRFLTDPGSYSTIPDLENIAAVLITHEHGDHLHIESLKKVLDKSPNAEIVTNQSVMNILEKENLSSRVVHIVPDGHSVSIQGIFVEGFGTKHHEIYKEIGMVENTGYFIGEKLFYPGDALTIPGKSVDILALPVAGPWINIHDAVEYALAVKPRVVFPVHDAVLKDPALGHWIPSQVLPQNSIDFVVIGVGETKEI